MKFLAIENEKWIYKSNVPSACIGFSVFALHPSEFLSYFQTISCSNSKAYCFKDKVGGGGDMEEILIIWLRFPLSSLAARIN